MSETTTANTPTYTLPRKSDGTPDWRSVLKSEHLYIKKEHKAKVATELGLTPADLEDPLFDNKRVNDRYLVIRKAGILELAALRGYRKAPPEVVHAQRDFVIVQTHITWLPFEGQDEVVTGGVGEATPENTSKMGCAYLAASAENRAFSRAVRQFLKIDIVSSDELGGGDVAPESDAAPTVSSVTNSVTPQGVLEKTAIEHKASFDSIKNAAIKRFVSDTEEAKTKPDLKPAFTADPNTWMKWQDIAPPDCMTLINLIKKGKPTPKK